MKGLASVQNLIKVLKKQTLCSCNQVYANECPFLSLCSKLKLGLKLNSSFGLCSKLKLGLKLNSCFGVCSKLKLCLKMN